MAVRAPAEGGSMASIRVQILEVEPSWVVNALALRGPPPQMGDQDQSDFPTATWTQIDPTQCVVKPLKIMIARAF